MVLRPFSPARGLVRKTPMIAVITPMAGTISGKTSPASPNAALPQDERGDQGDRIGLEQVRGHPGAVAHVVTDVVGDGRGVPRVVLGDVLLHLADQVGAHVGRLGEDAAADAHEHGQHGRAEPEALQDGGRVALEHKDHDRRAEQAQPDGGHAHVGAGAEGDLHRRVATLTARGRGHADVCPGGQPHAEESDQRREDRAGQEGRRARDPQGQALVLLARMHWEQQEEEERSNGEDAQCPELPGEVRARPLLHGAGDHLHLRGAVAGRQHLAAEHHRHHQGQYGDDPHDGDEGQVDP